MNTDSKNFELKNSSTDFASRSKDIFSSIDDLAKDKKKKSIAEDSSFKVPDAPVSESSRDDQYAQDFKGRESIFRDSNQSGWPVSSNNARPGSSKRRFDHDRGRNDDSRGWNRNKRPRRAPDHVVNPNKYTKYSLSDVSKDQLSDKSNTKAAFDFLRQLKETNDEKNGDKPGVDNRDQDGKIVFKKPKKRIESAAESSGSSSSVVKDGVKRVMPECVVGQRKKSSKKITNSLAFHDDDDE